MSETGKKVEIMFENALETYEQEMSLMDRVDVITPDAGDMQNSGNVIWRQKDQHAPVIEGWDMTGNETDIIQETYPAVLAEPKNDVFKQRADQLRDDSFWKTRGKASGRKQAATLNKAIADLITNTGSLYYEASATANGLDAIGEGQTFLNERQKLMNDDRTVCLNDRDRQKYASELSARSTMAGRPEDAFATGQIGSDVAGFDVFTGSFMDTLTGGTITDTTTTADFSGKPEAGSVNATTKVVTNIDYRTMTLPVVASAAYAVGDKVTLDNGSTPVEAIGLMDKTETGQAMTFTVISKPDATSLELYPKAIAADDSALSTLEKAYANIDTQVLSGATVTKLNIFTGTKKVNPFWCKSSIEVVGGDAPINLLSELDGMKVIPETMSNGQKMYMAYSGDILTLNFTCRIFTWWGLTNKDPSANGVFVTL